MSDFTSSKWATAAEAPNYQEELRSKLKDLKSSLTNRWVRWGDWERQFILSVTRELDNHTINVTPKQYQKIWLLWERSLK